MNSQMTLLAFAWRGGAAARATPSRWSMAPKARPVKPMPTSARNVRRWMPRQLRSGVMVGTSADGHEVVVVEQHVYQVLPRPCGGVGGGRGDGLGARRERRQPGGPPEQGLLLAEEPPAPRPLLGRRRPPEDLLEGGGHKRLHLRRRLRQPAGQEARLAQR